MATFYYLAVSVDDNRRMAGNIEADDERAAHEELNRMGLSVLGVSTEPFPEQQTGGEKETFSFEAQDKQGKDVDGTIEADDLLGAVERLETEFQFQLRALYPQGASDEEVAHARAHSLTDIARLRAERDAKSTAEKRNTLKGSLSDLVERAEKKLSGSKQSDARTEQLVAEAAREAAEDQKEERTQLEDMATEKATPLQVAPSADESAVPTAPTFTKSAVSDTDTPAASESAPATPSTESAPLSDDVDRTLYALINQLILPDTMTRQQALRELTDMALHHTGTANMRQISFQDAGSFAFTALTVLCGTLAAVYFGLFFVSQLAVSYSWGALSLLAESIVQQSTVVPFFAFAFLVLFSVLHSYHLSPRHAALRTGVLFAVCVGFLFIAGINVLY